MKILASESMPLDDFFERVRAVLRGLQNGRGDIKALQSELEGFCHLRIEELRIVYSQHRGLSSGWNTPIAATWFTKPS